eukprot:TRINITY_DN50020_c0_g1_i3.p3 TRINITY_DN50020_c0_g1~~TRINITY_DN50020_c0_g1_i3.p3  ORF type:complete len:117 (-),score=37.97 TRINITY_DN50020_c0_g1_i3:3-353(-)
MCVVRYSTNLVLQYSFLSFLWLAYSLQQFIFFCTFYVLYLCCFFFFFSSRRRHTRCREVSWARRCVQETGVLLDEEGLGWDAAWRITTSTVSYTNHTILAEALEKKKKKKKKSTLR